MNLDVHLDELMLEICRDLISDSERLPALTRVSRNIRRRAFEVLMNNCTIDLSSSRNQIIHSVMAHLFALVHDTTVPVPDVAIESTGDPLVDKLVKYASKFKTPKIDAFDRHCIRSTVSGSVLLQYISAVQVLESATMYGAKSWKSKFRRGKMEDLLRFLLRVTRHISTLEMGRSLEWMGQGGIQGMCPMLHALKLDCIIRQSFSHKCCNFIQLLTTKMLEFTRKGVKN
ncbi:uncharacterized protein EKO05_0008558 [Ascochyta rabiei]|uniref:Uncharacterized protein n=1 Tax=Didymella rabiei TaxID=5454 RepID=A0A163MMU8_DIDRA|nr:uncharacterized protein EKO05_0008558 [Ascochyta rabiei]KZM28852.1 hypothetical protein ST47_g35 [Ascochyta rabiei]UPX18252.1 hypothetical protein EKO05_0008558 [Ascochyta rabiei]